MWPGDRTPSYLLLEAAGSFACEMPQGLTRRRFEDGAKIYLISGISRENKIHDEISTQHRMYFSVNKTHCLRIQRCFIVCI
jgi:hypothetical protein